MRSSYLQHARDRTAAPACPSCIRTAQPLQAESCAYLADTARSRPHRGASAFCTAAQFSPRGLEPARLSCYVARLRPHRGVNLPLITAQLSPHGLCSCAFTSLCGTLATASRRQPAPHCRAAQSARVVQLCVHLAMWHACDRIAASTCAPHCRAAQPSRARLCAHLTMWQACATASRRQPAFHRRAAQPSRARPCAHLTRLVRPPRGVNLPFIVAQPSPRELGRALILQCGRLVRPPRGVNLPPILSQLSPRRLSGARADYSSARLRPHRGVSLPFIAAQLSPYAGSAVCAHTNHVARLRSHRGASLRPHCRAAQPSRTAALRAVLARLRPHHGLSLLFMPHNSVLTGVVVRPSC